MPFNNTLKQFKRKKTVEVEVGEGWVITVRKASAHNQEFRAKVAQFQKRQRTPKKKVRLGMDTTTSLTGTNDPRQDAEFFFEVFVVTWKGLKNDAGKETPPSKKVAVEIFSTDEGQVMLDMILAETGKDENFLIREEEEEIAGE